MAIELQDLQNATLSILNESSNSNAGELDSGTGSSPTISTTATLTEFINEACAHLCKTCIYVPEIATGTYPSSAQNMSFSSLTGASSRQLWAFRTLTWNSTQLTPIEDAYINIYYPSLQTMATGTPLYAYNVGQYGFGLAPIPSVSETVSLTGPSIPAPLVISTDTVTWLDGDDAMTAIVYYAAWKLAQKNSEDPTLQQKIGGWFSQFEAAKQRIWLRFIQTNPIIAKAYYSAPASIMQVNDQNVT